MSTQPATTTTTTSSTSKPITAAFDLQTKIRVIIQEVLAATMRKISQFNEKVETFEKFFFTYTQRMGDIEEKGKTNQHSLARLFDTVMKNKQTTEGQLIKLDEKNQSLKLQKNHLTQQVKQINKKINTIQRQNQTINNQFSNTKKKFLQYSELMTGLKEEVSWKITKYVEDTAQINTKIQINNEEIKKEYFNINLALEKNKEKYEEIISTRDRQDSLNQQFKQTLQTMQNTIKQKSEQIIFLNKKLDDMDTALYAKLKLTESKLERRIDDLSESNQKIEKMIGKVDGFSKILEEVREDSEKVRRQLLKKFEESDQKHKDHLEKEVLAINMNILNYEKATDKKIRTITESQQKNIQFFNQKMQYLKIQIQTQISSKATKMLEQKSKSQSSVSNTVMQQIQQRINKLTLQTKKQMNKMENIVKDLKIEVKHQMEDVKETVETRITSTVRAIQESSGSGVSPEFVQAINEKIEKVADVAQGRLEEFGKEMADQTARIKAVQTMKSQTETKFTSLSDSNTQKFNELEQKINAKVQRVLYTVTKMRGDAIIRNQFTDKQIKQLKKTTQSSQKQITTILKLFPALGQCINLIMCLIFDAEYQHSRIIQQTLPGTGKNVMKFQNLVEGVLYEYMEKKKPGWIMYRHKEMKKIDIVKATFNGYIRIWEDLFDNQLRSRQDFIPKSFYRKYVEKNLGTGTTPRDGKNSPNKDNSQPTNIQYRESSPGKDRSIEPLSEDSRNYIKGSSSNIGGGDSNANNNGSSDNMNRSFHIRKKKITTIKSKDDLVMVVQEDVKEEK